MNLSLPIYVAGHRGLVGSAILRALRRRGAENLIFADRQELDLTRQQPVADFFARKRPAYVFLAAARVGGIQANSKYPADFIRDNLAIELNVVEAAYKAGCTKLVMLGSSCIYPRLAAQPIREDALLSGPLEPTNAPYAIAKIAGIALCEAFARQYGMQCISLMPTNLFGPGDNFDLTTSHVVPALIRRIHEARIAGASEISVWGTGNALREFLFVDDLAEACLFLCDSYDRPEPINVGSGVEITIRELAGLIARVVGYEGGFTFDSSRPDGTPRKLLDSSRLRALGWSPQVTLEEGLHRTYDWYLANYAHARGVSPPLAALTSADR